MGHPSLPFDSLLQPRLACAKGAIVTHLSLMCPPPHTHWWFDCTPHTCVPLPPVLRHLRAVGIGLLVLLARRAGISLSVVGVGVDFLQVVSLFSSFGFDWPVEMKSLFKMASASTVNEQLVCACHFDCISALLLVWFWMLRCFWCGSGCCVASVGVFFVLVVVEPCCRVCA